MSAEESASICAVQPMENNHELYSTFM